MKTLTANMTTHLSSNFDIEPVVILSIDWSGDGQDIMYADKDIDTVRGRILSLGNLESLLSTKTGSSQTLQFTLDDTDGAIKANLDIYDPYGKPCRIYQYFDDQGALLTLDDKILMFKGHINYDVAWNEQERTVTLTVITKVEEREVGFSPEEGQFDFVSPDAVGKAWPLCFGSPLHVPATLITSANVATLNDLICIVDPLLVWKRDILYQAILANYSMYKYYRSVAITTQTQVGYSAQQLLDQVLINIRDRAAQIATYNTHLTNIAVLKQKIAQIIRGRVDGNLVTERANLAAEQAAKRSLEDTTIGPITGQLELLVELIPTLEAGVEQRQNAFGKQVEAIYQISALYQQYLDVDIEICKQRECETTSVRVKDGDNFPQDTVVDVLINNLRFRGTFSNDVFTIQSMLPKYQNIVLAARETIPSPCDPTEEYRTFWVASEDIQLGGMYILINSSRDGKNHICKVTSQEGRKCTLELAHHTRNTQSDEVNAQVNWSSPAVSVGTQTFDREIYQNVGYQVGAFGTSAMDNFVLEVTRPEYMTALGQLPFDVSDYISGNNPAGLDLRPTINKDLFELLLRLSKLRDKDNLYYQAEIGDLTPVKAYTVHAYDFTTIIEASPVILQHWLTNNILVDELPDSSAWEASQGATIGDASNSCQIRVANILPSTVHSVSAFRVVDGNRDLVTLPTRYYTEQQETLGTAPNSLDLTTIRTKLPLSTLNEGWEDEIYVSLTSSVGPNIVDIIEHLVTTYTDKTVDSTSFDAVKDLLQDDSDEELYPAHFALLTRRNVFEQINEIAQQARCIVYVINDVYYIKYLSVEPTPVRTLTTADVEQGTMLISYTDLTNVVTRLVAIWNRDYSGSDEPNRLTLRHNIQKYGLHESEQNYYIYNIESLVQKSATFWLIRNCNSWKRVQLTVKLKHLDLETFDAVTLDLPYISTGTIVALVEDTQYNTENNTVTLSLWLPIKSGEMTQDTFAWPGSADETDEFALDGENVGSGNAVISGTLPSC